jgi:hypothetical protein
MALARDTVIQPINYVTAAATTGSAVTNLNWAVQVGGTYRFRVGIAYTVAATTTGISISIVPTGVTTAATFFTSTLYGADATGTIDGGGIATYAAAGATAGAAGVPTALANSSATAGNMVWLEGLVVPAATQVLQVEVIPEAAAAITVIAGSYIDWQRMV